MLLPTADTNSHISICLASQFTSLAEGSKSKTGPKRLCPITLSPEPQLVPSRRYYFCVLGPCPEASHFYPKQQIISWGGGTQRAFEHSISTPLGMGLRLQWHFSEAKQSGPALSRRKNEKQDYSEYFWPPEWGWRIPLASLIPIHTEQALLIPILEVYKNCKIQERGIYDVTVSRHEEIVSWKLYTARVLCVGALPPLICFSFSPSFPGLSSPTWK